MDSRHLAVMLRSLCRFGVSGKQAEPTDRHLLEHFALRRDEAAFAVLVQRHGGMVWNVCRRVLGNAADADDAFQATFLVLLHKAAALRGRESLAGFLQGVAWRLARKLRADGLRRQYKEMRVETRCANDPLAEAQQRDLRELLDEELDRLPEKYRVPLVLCHLEGLTYSEAARHLGWRHGTICGRLARGRELLRRRLVRRGLMLSSTALLATLTPARAAPAACVAAVLRMAGLFALGSSAVELIPSSISTLAQGLLPTLTAARMKVVALALAVLVCTSAGLAAHWALRATEAPQHDRPAANVNRQTPERANRQPPRDHRMPGLPSDAITRLGTLRFRHGANVFGIAFTPDGKQMVSADWFSARLWETATGREIRQLGPRFDTSLRSLSLSADGKTIALTEHHHGVIQVYEVATGNLLRQLHNGPDNDDRFCSVSLAPGGKVLATVAGKKIRLWSIAEGKELRALSADSEWVHDLLFSPDGKALISGGEDGKIHFWDTATGNEVRHLDHPGRVMELELSADGKVLASVGGTRREHRMAAGALSIVWLPDNKVHLWDVATGKKLRQLEVPYSQKKKSPVGELNGQGIVRMRLAPNGKTLVTVGQDRILRIWDVALGNELRQWKAGWAVSLAFSPDGKILATGGTDASVRMWDPATGRELGDQAGHQGGVHSLVISADGRRLATGGGDGSVHIWEAATGREIQRLHGPAGEMRPLFFSPHGRTLTTVGMELTSQGADKKGRVWDIASGREIKQIADLPASFLCAVSPDGRAHALIGYDGQLQLWDEATDRSRRLRIEASKAMAALAFSPGNRFLLTCGYDGKVRVWDVATEKEQRQFALGTEKEFLAAAFSPDGRWVAWASREGRVCVHDVATGEEAHHFTGPPFGSALAFSPDGRALAVAGMFDPAIQLWEVAAGRLRHSLRGHQGRIFTLVFSADGKRLASGSEDTTALLWDLTGEHSEHKPLLSDPSRRWKDLASADAETAYRAMQALAASPEPTVAFLQQQLQPIPHPDAQRVALRIRDLGRDSFAARDKASNELGKLGSAVEPALRAALADSPSPEAHRRLRSLLARLDSDRRTPSPTLLQALRAIEVLERIGDTPARRLLERLARGAPGAYVTREAAAAVSHLQQ